MKKENNLENESKAEENSRELVDKKFDFYEAALKYEEEEAVQHTEAEDRTLFMKTSQNVKELLKEILRLKNEKPDEWPAAVEECKVKVLMHMLSLKRLSRIQKIRVKESREKSADFRQEVDGITLLLQNLLYEVAHLKKEVRKCMEFRSADTEIDLVSVEQFYKEAPENICRPEKTVGNPHQQRLAQLHWELEQRRGQTQLTDKLTQEKNSLAEIINGHESKLNSLLPRINEILEATLPLQKSLDLPLEDNKQQQKVSEYLPPPLYTLWTQISAYGEACDASLSAEILGDVEAACKLNAPEEENDDSDSDADLDIQEEKTRRKKRSQKESKITNSEDSNKQLLYALHPLHILLTITTKGNNAILVKFYYALHLRIVTVKCSLQLPTPSSQSLLVNLLDQDTILDFLFPGDSGMESPNPSNVYQFSKAKINESNLSAEQLNTIGKPYKWAQTLSGLSFVPCESPVNIGGQEEIFTASIGEADEKSENLDDSEIQGEKEKKVEPQKFYTETLSWKMSVDHMHLTIMAVKRRLQSRLALQSQLIALETAKSMSSIPVPSEALQQLFPGKVSSNFCSWKPVAWTDYVEADAIQHLIKYNMVDRNWFTFKAIYQRQSVTLDAYVAISPDYPSVAPVFGLELLWNGNYTASNHPHVMQLESELNAYYSELFSGRSDRLYLLSLQLYRLGMSLDILTEASSITKLQKSSNSQTEFHKEKIFFRTNRGPDRALPYKYLPKLGVFAQR